MRENEFDNFDTPNVYMITDGGPEHRLTFESVKISLMLFKELNIDFLVAIRTASGIVTAILWNESCRLQILGCKM